MPILLPQGSLRTKPMGGGPSGGDAIPVNEAAAKGDEEVPWDEVSKWGVARLQQKRGRPLWAAR